MIYWSYFLISSIAFFLMVLHISAYCICCLSSPFPTISRRFVNRARVGDDIIYFSGLLIVLATLDALCWIMSLMVSLMVSMPSSSCRVTNRFLNSRWNSIFFDPIYLASTLGGLLVINVFLSTSTTSLILFITILWSLPMLTWLIDDCYVCDEVWPFLFGCSPFRSSLHRLGFSTSISSLRSYEIWYS